MKMLDGLEKRIAMTHGSLTRPWLTHPSLLCHIRVAGKAISNCGLKEGSPCESLSQDFLTVRRETW
jgi:hypothetical protein